MSTSICDLNHRAGDCVVGQYTLLTATERTSQIGQRYKVLELADHTGELSVYVWENSGLLECVPPRMPAPIHADLHVRTLSGRTVADLRAIHELEPHEATNAAALLPFKRCAPDARNALTGLVQFVEELHPEILREFLNRVLLDPRVAATLTTCKASQGHHHREPGGLLLHSMEVVEIVANMAGTRLDPVERALTEVGALLHDLGKLRAIGAGNVRPIHYALGSHESQTVRILDPHLEWLRARDRSIAAGLEYLLQFLLTPPRERGFAKFIGGDLIVAADHMSAALRNGKRLDDLFGKVGIRTDMPGAANQLTRITAGSRVLSSR